MRSYSMFMNTDIYYVIIIRPRDSIHYKHSIYLLQNKYVSYVMYYMGLKKQIFPLFFFKSSNKYNTSTVYITQYCDHSIYKQRLNFAKYSQNRALLLKIIDNFITHTSNSNINNITITM